MSLDENTTRQRVIAAIAEILEIETSGIEGSNRLREDLGMDSLASLELLSVLGQEFKVDLEMEQAMEIQTVDDTYDFIERHRREQGVAQPASGA